MVEFRVAFDEVQVFVNGTTLLGHIDGNGLLPTPGRFTPETLKAVATKAKEVREWGVNPELCPSCKGTPYFPVDNCSSPRHLEFY